MKIINSLKTHLKEQYAFNEQDIIMYTYVIEDRILFWKYRRIIQVWPNLSKAVYDHEKATIVKLKLIAQRDYQQMWEWLTDYESKMK